MTECKICGKIVDNNRKLSWHLRNDHNMNLQKYFVDILENNPPGCIVCGANTSFDSIEKGFKKTCSSKCACTEHRRNLKQNTEKYNNFVLKVSNNMKTEWKTKDQTTRIENMTKTIRNIVSTMTEDEKKEKFGYLNKLSKEERDTFIYKILQTGCHKWWKEATETEKLDLYEKRSNSIRKTWEERGHEIIKKQIDTFTSNQNNKEYFISEEEMKVIDNSLSKLFNMI